MPGSRVTRYEARPDQQPDPDRGEFDEPVPSCQVVVNGAVQVKLTLITPGQQELWRVAAGGAFYRRSLLIGEIKEVGVLMDDLVSPKRNRHREQR